MSTKTLHLNLPRRTLLSASIAGLLLAPAARAATVTVDSTADDNGTGCTLREAIVSINNGAAATGCSNTGDAFGSADTILFDTTVSGTITLNGSQLEIAKPVYIYGPGADRLAVDGDGQSRVLYLNQTSATIEGLTIQNGYSSISGGGIATNGSELTLTDCTISGNSTDDNGGGIASVFDSVVSLYNSTVSGNSAPDILVSGNGGGIFSDSSFVGLYDSTVSGNSSGSNGGGIASKESSLLVLIDSTVSDNSASDTGGGIILDSSTAGLHNSTVYGNSAVNYGGGIGSEESSLLELINSTVSGNSANSNGESVVSNGGGIIADSSTVRLYNSAVHSNSAAGSILTNKGGGIYSDSSLVTVYDSSIHGNSAAEDGGGIASADSSRLKLINSTVSGNSAADDGGGIYAHDGTLTVTNSSVYDNSVAGDGGGISADEVNLTVTNSSVCDNSVAGDGGGILGSSDTTLKVSNSIISGNSAAVAGGGIFAVLAKALAVTNSTISGNSADGEIGGGIAAYNAELTNSTISGNSAGSDGGGIFAYNAELTNSTVSGNSAGSEGGGVFVYDSTVTLTNSIIANSAGGGDCQAENTHVAGSYNLIGDSGDDACGLNNDVDSNIIGTDPDLEPLADNGCMTRAGDPDGPPASYGCVQTHALSIGSPALDAADDASAPETDERGATRPAGSGDDMGAFELGPPNSPTGVSATVGAAQATVSWTPPTSPGLAALTACTATAEPGGATCTAPAGTNQCTITGLTPGTGYIFTVACDNASGITGLDSAASNVVTPAAKPIPTLSVWGLLGSAGLLGLFGAWRQRRLAGRPRR